MNNHNITHTGFAASLELELNLVRSFITLLQKEQDDLIQGITGRTDSVTLDKSNLVQELAQFGDQRNRYLLSQGLTPDNKGMNTWLEEHADQHTATTWFDLIHVARIAHRLNLANGKIIESRLQYCRRACNTLQEAAGATTLYGPEGYHRVLSIAS